MAPVCALTAVKCELAAQLVQYHAARAVEHIKILDQGFRRDHRNAGSLSFPALLFY